MSADKDKITNRVMAALLFVCMITTAFAFVACTISLAMQLYK